MCCLIYIVSRACIEMCARPAFRVEFFYTRRCLAPVKPFGPRNAYYTAKNSTSCFSIVGWTMLWQCCWTKSVVQHWWSNNGCSWLLKQEKTILIKQALFVVIVVAQLCQQVVTILMVEQCCNNIVIMAEQPCWQHCSRLLTSCNRSCVFTRVGHS